MELFKFAFRKRRKPHICQQKATKASEKQQKTLSKIVLFIGRAGRSPGARWVQCSGHRGVCLCRHHCPDCRLAISLYMQFLPDGRGCHQCSSYFARVTAAWWGIVNLRRFYTGSCPSRDEWPSVEKSRFTNSNTINVCQDHQTDEISNKVVGSTITAEAEAMEA